MAAFSGGKCQCSDNERRPNGFHSVWARGPEYVLLRHAFCCRSLFQRDGEGDADVQPAELAKQAKRTLLVTVKAELAEVKQQAKSAEAAKAEVSWQLKQCASQQTQLKVSHAARRTPSGGWNGPDPLPRSTRIRGWGHPDTLERPALRMFSER
jgi:hypothetical protein